MTQPNSTEKNALTPTDAAKTKEPEHKTQLSNSVWESIKQDYVKPVSWVEGNVLAPMYNEAVVKPVNTVIDKAQMLHAPVSKLEKAAVPDAQINTPEFYIQNAASTAANFGSQLVAGHFAGKAWRNVGESFTREAERSALINANTAKSIRSFASNRMLHNVTGAVAYAGIVDPEEGQSRRGNMLAAAEGMALF